MAKKRKPKSPKNRARRRKRSSPTPADGFGGPATFDRRTMEGAMRQMIPGFGSGERTPLDEAQEIMYEAFEAEGEPRIALAEEALRVSPDCADAYVLLAEYASDPEAALELYEQGVEAAERALGKQRLAEYEGEFWGLLETRPYMRAREGLAQCLWELDCKAEAIEHYRDLLRLNPNDNQGIRYLLAHALLDLDRDVELRQLLVEYDDDVRADWTYTKALAAFRYEGATPRARTLLDQAAEYNELVPEYLVGNRPLPSEPPPYISIGGEDEAMMYAGQFLPAWRNTPGALTWLRRSLKVSLPEAPPRRRSGWKQLKTTLTHLAQDTDEVWQVDARPYPMEFAELEGVKPWLVCVADTTHDEILSLDIEDERPSTREVWEAVLRAMRHPRQGDPRRPGAIEVRLKTFASAWSDKLSQIRIDCRHIEDLDFVDRFLAENPILEEAGRVVAEGADVTELERRDLTDLPLYPDTIWQVDVRRMTTWLDNDGDPQRPRMAIVANCSEGTVLSHELSTDAPSEQVLWEAVLKALWTPLTGDLHRPAEIQVVAPEYRDLLTARLGASEIECTVHDRLDMLDEMLADLDRAINGPDQPMAAMIDSPGMSADQVGEFFTAADVFYRNAPWRRTAPDSVIKIEAERIVREPCYAIVMGQSGMTVGLVLYEDLELLRDLLDGDGDGDDEANGRKTAGLSVFFDDDRQMASGDLDAAERYAWPISGPEAYPTAMRINPGMSVRPPLAWELALLSAALRAIPQLVDANAEKAIVRIPSDAGEIELRLAWFDPF